MGNRELALAALRPALARAGEIKIEAGHLPAVLRCAIRLTMTEIEESKGNPDIEPLCKLLEKGAYCREVS